MRWSPKAVALTALCSLIACDPYSARELSAGTGGTAGAGGAAGAGAGAGGGGGGGGGAGAGAGGGSGAGGSSGASGSAGAGACPINGSFCDAQGSVIFCEDFESGTRNQNAWPAVLEDGGNIAIDSARAHCGTYSLRSTLDGVASTPESPTAQWEHHQSLPAEFALRLWLYLPAPLPAESVQFVALVNSVGEGAQLNAHDVIQLNSWAGPGSFDQGFAVMPRDEWICVEWVIKPGATEVWVEGTQQMAPAMTTPAYSVLGVGAGYFQVSDVAGTETFIDDITITNTRLGCP